MDNLPESPTASPEEPAMPPEPPIKPPEDPKMKWVRIATLVFVVALSVTLFIFRDRIKELEALGYPGIFLFSMLTNATLILPMPGVIVTSLMGAVFNPFWVAIAAGSGAALGEFSGYLAGFSGQKVAERTPAYVKLENWMKKYGGWTILVLGFIPNPLFDIAGLMAGTLKMPPAKFLFWCWLGKVLKMMLFAYGGALGFSLLPE
ncbi:MAG: VTT domain-containing protein [Anaerolineaceae bacterium]|nr:VTT domain-containing protein [Anaerolineaceae bacterium]